jgi:putative ABC transport system permease protein
MRALDRKLLRDLVRMRLQAGAIALLIACGVSVAVMAFSAQEALIAAQGGYYARTRFADVFATAKRAPLAVADALQAIDGVAAVDARAMKGGLMQAPGLVRPASATLIALPDDDRRALNRLVLIQGRMPDPDRTDEAVALKTFLDAAHVRLGERLTMVIDGRQMSFAIVGSVLSPEFVYVPGPGSMMPDDAHQGVFWAPRLTVGKATGLDGAFSMVSLKLAPGAAEPAVLAAVDRALAPYGGTPSVGRADQISNKFQDDRIARFGVIAWVIPPVFLAVAAGLVHMVLGRMVEAERDQIGLLKAFGYRNGEVGALYLKMAALIGLIGAGAGGALGGWMGGAVTRMLAQYMRFPRLDLRFSWTAFAVAAGFSVAAAVAGSLLAVRRAARLSPAVAMQPPAPTVFRKGLAERQAVWGLLDQPTRMIVRNLERFPARAALTLAGLGVSLSLLVGSQFMFGSLDAIVDQAYFKARHWSDVIGFAENRDARPVVEARRLPGVIAAEPMRVAAIRIRAHGHEQKAAITGLDPDARLARALDAADRPIPLKGRGLVLSTSLALRLGVRPGDVVEIEVTEGRRPRVVLPVTALAQDYAGLSAFIARDALNRLMGDGDVASGVNLLTAADRRPDFYRAVERAPMIAAAASRGDTVSAFRTTVAQTVDVEMGFFLGFAGAIAFGVAYNVSRIALSDRARDLATLRVLGFDQLECAYILLGELLFLALLATPLGVLGGVALAKALVAAFSRQEMQFPFIITAHSYGMAFAAYLTAVLAAVVLVGQRIWSLDLVAALKTRD